MIFKMFANISNACGNQLPQTLLFDGGGRKCKHLNPGTCVTSCNAFIFSYLLKRCKCLYFSFQAKLFSNRSTNKIIIGATKRDEKL